MKKQTVTPLLGQVLAKVAPRIGARVVIEPRWGIVGQITYKGGRKRYFRYSSLDLNSMGASEVAKDKDYANFFMKLMGYPIVPGSKTFFSARWARAIGIRNRGVDDSYRYARSLGFPVFVKPNSGSQGSGVALVHNRREFYMAMRRIFVNDRVALVQKALSGRDYRLVVLDRKLISAYERVALSVVGDGHSSIRELLRKKQKGFVASSRDTQIKLADPRMAAKLARQGLSIHSRPDSGERVFLLDNANLSTGGDSIDITKSVHPAFRRLAIRLTRDMGLRLCGVDLMVAGDIRDKPDKYWVLEINSAPGLDHYAKMGKAQEKVVEKLYLEVLRSMGRAR